MYPLSEVANGSNVWIIELIDSPLKVKLLEMGMITGKKLRVLYRAPLGDPIAVDIDGYVLSLRMDEAKLVLVDQLSETT